MQEEQTPDLSQMNRPLSTQEVSRYLGLCERQVLRMVHSTTGRSQQRSSATTGTTRRGRSPSWSGCWTNDAARGSGVVRFLRRLPLLKENGRQTSRVQSINDTCGDRVDLLAHGIGHGLIALSMGAEKTPDSSLPGKQRGHSGTCT